MGRPGATPRVVSLVPSITETLLDWGVPVAACTRFCEQPLLRHVGGTKNPDLTAIVALAPDVVLMDTEENRREDADALLAEGVLVVATDVHAITDVDPALALVAEAVGRRSVPGPADLVSRALQHLNVECGASESRRSALVPIWRRPWMVITADTYGGSLLAVLGVDVQPSGPDRYPEIDLGAQETDLVVVPSEPYTFDDTHLDEIAAACPRSRIIRVDGQDLFWWGSRTPDAIGRLAAAIG